MAVRSRTGRNEVMRHSRKWVDFRLEQKTIEFLVKGLRAPRRLPEVRLRLRIDLCDDVTCVVRRIFVKECLKQRAIHAISPPEPNAARQLSNLAGVCKKSRGRAAENSRLRNMPPPSISNQERRLS